MKGKGFDIQATSEKERSKLVKALQILPEETINRPSAKYPVSLSLIEGSDGETVRIARNLMDPY